MTRVDYLPRAVPGKTCFYDRCLVCKAVTSLLRGSDTEEGVKKIKNISVKFNSLLK